DADGRAGLKALAHITGGGFPENIPRVLPKALGVRLELASIEVPPGFRWLAATRPRAEDREAFQRSLDGELSAHRIELVCLAGFMRRLTPWFVARWEGKLLNIHPSLLPAFTGLHTHARALAEGVKLHGASVHFVTEELDEGPVIAQSAVPVLPGD